MVLPFCASQRVGAGSADAGAVSGYAEPGKAIPVTQKLLFKSRYAIVTPDAPGLNISRQIRDDDRRDRLLEIAHERWRSEMGLSLRSVAACAMPMTSPKISIDGCLSPERS